MIGRTKLSGRWRFTLIVVLVLGFVVSAVPLRVGARSIDPAGTFSPAWTESNFWGVTGARAFSDTPGEPGASCTNNLGGSPQSVDVRIQSVRLAPADGYEQQTTAVR